MLSGFKQFILRGNVIDLAVAVVIGAAFGALVTALVESFITPLIAAIGGQPDFSELAFTINDSRFAYGAFINALLSFLIVAAVVYFFVVAPMNALLTRLRTEPTPDPLTRKCPFCLSEIQNGATRCPFCTSELPAA
ncbi:MAG: Large-conductance mechanosensitive channel [uncultured Thermomicrobiales bacterium]|uniref:Large-conductance mechanosensitive channel n=1 Tax=uncultured Thermomicrobiales bacterium TaxID=1645740 RepID=A0A6J4U1M5_9BACT|nr:MAG: Large-conductance mechanosensitive channel [uncultured Thermomicrobiales bacterium]